MLYPVRLGRHHAGRLFEIRYGRCADATKKPVNSTTRAAARTGATRSTSWPWAKLVSLTPAQLARLPIPEDLLPHIAECKRITAHIAHKRQLAFLAKHMRREEEATLDAIRDALDANSETGRREVAMMHRVEDWRDRLLAEGDKALALFSTIIRRPIASSCARWCATRRPKRPGTNRRAPTVRFSRCCAA